MPLFDHFPYSNLHELNLDWIISKLKDVDKAQMTAQQASDLLDQVSDKADEAKGYAESAHDDAVAAHSDAQNAHDDAAAAHSDAADAAFYKQGSYDASILAKGYKEDAQTASGNADNQALAAYNAKVDAQQAASDALAAKIAAAGSAADALADANRAQAYGASTGVASLAGSITAQSSDDVSLNDGTYLIIHFGTDSQSSKGLNMFTLAGSTLVRRNLLQTGANVVMSTSGANVVHIVNYMTDGDMYYLILGYMEP